MALINRPTNGELEILNVLWEGGPATVREVNEKLSLKRQVGYTTTLKLMQIMTEKRLLVRNEEKRTHIYTAAVDEQDTKKRMLDKFLDTAFSGSAQKLVMEALGSYRATPDELAEIKKLIEKLEQNGTA